MAEALLEKFGNGRFRAYSAGTAPAREPLPEVLERLKNLGHDIFGSAANPGATLRGRTRLDFVLALCDVPHRQCYEELGGQLVMAAWPLPDPAKFSGSASERTTLLNELYAMIRRRIESLRQPPVPIAGS